MWRIRATQSDHLICARGTRAAELLDKILRVTKPGDISVEQVDKFELKRLPADLNRRDSQRDVNEPLF